MDLKEQKYPVNGIRNLFTLTSQIFLKILSTLSEPLYRNGFDAHDLKSKAFLAFTEFGPELRIPREKRLIQKFPQLSTDQINTWITDYRKYEHLAFDIAIQHRHEEWQWKNTIKKLKEVIPDLNEKAIDKLLNQACYYAWREGH